MGVHEGVQWHIRGWRRAVDEDGAVAYKRLAQGCRQGWCSGVHEDGAVAYLRRAQGW